MRVRDAQGAAGRSPEAVRRAAAGPATPQAARRTAGARRTDAKRSHRAAGVGAAKRRNAESPAAARPARGLSRAALLLVRPPCPRAGHALSREVVEHAEIHDVCISLENMPGALAEMGEFLGRAEALRA